jgi:hypothetical protein
MSTLPPVDADGVGIDAQAPRVRARPAAAKARESLRNEVLDMIGSGRWRRATSNG